jgi:hypothetical protein
MKNPFTQLTIKWFIHTYTLDEYFILLFFNCLVERYVKYISYVLSYDHTMFNCIFITPHNFNYQIVNLNRYRVSKFDAKKEQIKSKMA